MSPSSAFAPRVLRTVLFLLALATSLPAQTTFTVTNPGDGGPASLRFWLASASSGDTIVFDQSLDGQVLTLNSELLLNNLDILIDASTLAGGLTLSGDTGTAGDPSDNVRLFRLAGTSQLELRNLTLRDGNSANNAVSPTLGGAILGETGSALTLCDCMLLDNQSNGDGGAVSAPSITAERCTFDTNTAVSAGGAIAVDAGTAQFSNCTFSRNNATQGGALFFQDSDLTVASCTFALNEALTDGGAIRTLGSFTASLASSTVSGNSANLTGGGLSFGGTLHLENSVIAGNSADTGPDLSGTAASVSGVNFVGDSSGAGGLGTLGADYLTGDARLQPLANYGGPTETLRPASNSPLIDSGINPTPPATDQRGQARVIDGDGDGTATIDIGAVEFDFTPLVVTTALDENDGALGLGTGDSLRECIAEANADPGPDRILFDPLLDGANIPVTGTELTFEADLGLDGSTLANPPIISADGTSSVFRVLSNVSAELTYLHVINPGSTPGQAGIRNEGILSLERCQLTDHGEAVVNEVTGDLTIIECALSQNKVGLRNGGVAQLNRTQVERNRTGIINTRINGGADLTIRESSILANFQPVEGIPGVGGGAGVLNAPNCVCLIDFSTVAHNRTPRDGGAVLNLGTATIRSSTIVNNRARYGGGIYSAGPITIEHCTITKNIAQIVGGVFNGAPTSTLANTIVAGNIAVASPNSTGLSRVNSLVNDDPLLHPLGDYGGPTETMPPRPGSPAIDAGTVPGPLPATDQRGQARLLDGDGSPGATVDIGAVGTNPAETIFSPTDQASQLPLRSRLLSWSFGPLADSYEIFLGTDPADLGSIGITTSRALQSGPLEPDTLYYWQIDANTGGSVTSSPLLRFTTRSALLVTTPLDEDDGDLGLGSGDSLREVLEAANQHVDFDAIGFAPTLDGVPITLAGDQLEAVSDLCLDGTTLDEGVTLSGNNTSRVLLVATGARVQAKSVHVINGRAATGAGVQILDGGCLEADDSTFTNCFATSTVAGGAAIFSQSFLSLRNCSIRDNETMDAGAIASFQAKVSIVSTTIAQNRAARAPALFADESGLLLQNSTIAENDAPTGGIPGAIYVSRFVVAGETADFVCEHCTIVDSVLPLTSPSSFASTGITNSIFSPVAPDLPSGIAATNVVGSADELVAPLAQYACPTATRPPLFNSAAIDAGGPTSLAVDQHGLPRQIGTAPDAGAVEMQSSAIVTNSSPNGSGSLRGATTTIQPGGTIDFDPSLSGATITISPAPDGSPMPLVLVASLDASALPNGLTISGGGTTPIVEVPTGLATSLDSINLRFGSSAEDGGGIINRGDLTLQRCTVANCLSLGRGGGIYNTGTLSLINSTLAGNLAGFEGGGIYNDGGSVLGRHATIAGNDSFFAAAGGLFNDNGTLDLENSVLTGNRAATGEQDLSGPFTELGNNLLTGDPLLAPLANYGGPTLTRPPLPGSPALEGAVLLGTTPPTDQLGNPRPAGPLPDLGSVEAVSVAAALAPLTDSEPDGIPDILEGLGGPYPHLTVGIDDSALDTDGDRVPDAQEIADMTDLFDGNDRFRILRIAPAPGFDAQLNPLVEVTLSTFPGLSYAFETDHLLQNFQPFPGSSLTADDFEETVQLLLLPGGDFVRARRD